MDVFLRYLFAYPVHTANADTVAKVVIDSMGKHTFWPTILVSDKGSIFASQILAEVAAALGIQLRHATTKHAQTIGKLERAHASVEVTLTMAECKFRQEWHKYLPLAVLQPQYDISCIFGL